MFIYACISYKCNDFFEQIIKLKNKLIIETIQNPKTLIQTIINADSVERK